MCVCVCVQLRMHAMLSPPSPLWAWQAGHHWSVCKFPQVLLLFPLHHQQWCQCYCSMTSCQMGRMLLQSPWAVKWPVLCWNWVYAAWTRCHWPWAEPLWKAAWAAASVAPQRLPLRPRQWIVVTDVWLLLAVRHWPLLHSLPALAVAMWAACWVDVLLLTFPNPNVPAPTTGDCAVSRWLRSVHSAAGAASCAWLAREERGEG